MFWKKKEKSIEIKSVDESSDNQKYFLKIVLLGDGAVGKTNIRKNYSMTRIYKRPFDDNWSRFCGSR